MQFVHGLDLQSQFVHERDEQRHNVCDAFAGVSLVIPDGDGSILLDSFQGSRTVQTELANKGIDCGEFIALDLLKGHLVLHEKLGTGGRVLLWRYAVPDVGLLQVLKTVDDREEVSLEEDGGFVLS